LLLTWLHGSVHAFHVFYLLLGSVEGKSFCISQPCEDP
jgi:hypothetical protein